MPEKLLANVPESELLSTLHSKVTDIQTERKNEKESMLRKLKRLEQKMGNPFNAAVTEDSLKDFHAEFVKKIIFSTLKPSSWNILSMQPLYTDILKIMVFIAGDEAQKLAPNWFSNQSKNPKWTCAIIPKAAVIWTEICNLYGRLGTNISRHTLESFFLSISFIANGLQDLKFNEFPGTKKFIEAQKQIMASSSVKDIFKTLNSIGSTDFNFAHINTSKSDFEPFLDHKIEVSETWDPIQFRTPIKGIDLLRS